MRFALLAFLGYASAVRVSNPQPMRPQEFLDISGTEMFIKKNTDKYEAFGMELVQLPNMGDTLGAGSGTQGADAPRADRGFSADPDAPLPTLQLGDGSRSPGGVVRTEDSVPDPTLAAGSKLPMLRAPSAGGWDSKQSVTSQTASWESTTSYTSSTLGGLPGAIPPTASGVDQRLGGVKISITNTTNSQAASQEALSVTDAPADQSGTTRVPGLPVIETHKADNSDAQIIFGLPVEQSPENQFGEANVAGKKVVSVPELLDPRRGTYKWSPGKGQEEGNNIKVQREPPFLFDGVHPQYHSTQTVGHAGQDAEFSNGGTLPVGAIGSGVTYGALGGHYYQ